MKNILYIGNYKDHNGFGQSCRRFIKLLGGNPNWNLVTRPLYVTNSSITPTVKEDNFAEYENNICRKYDTLIQHTMPEYIEYHKNFGKNIAIAEIETTNIRHSGWIDKLNLMDEIWVHSIFSAESLVTGGVIKPIKIVPQPYDIEVYNKKQDSFFDYDINNFPFIFYTIGQYAEKKNIKNIILAYLLEFNKKDNVRLFLKTCDHRRKNEDLENLIKFDMSNIKSIIRKSDNECADIDIVCGYMSDNDIIRLHQSSNCYINTIKADSFGDCAIEAAICGKTIINTKNIGSSTYFNSTNALMVNSIKTPVLCSNPPLKNIYTINEQWHEPSIDDIRKCMRSALNMTKEDKDKIVSNFNTSLFTYESIYKIIS